MGTILGKQFHDAIASGGVSDTAYFVVEKAREAKLALLNTFTFGNAYHEALQALAAIQEVAKHGNWDGYNAEPISDATIWSAYRFLEALPLGLTMPTVGAEPDGDISLEWYVSPRRTLSVSVSSDGFLYYAALFEPNKQCGTEAFFGEAPETIVSLIRQVWP